MLTALEIYERLYAAHGQPRWWSDDAYIVMVQSVLVQNTNWALVEKVTESIAEWLTPARVSALNAEALENLIRPCGFCRGKAACILRLTQWYEKYGYAAENLARRGTGALREELLRLKGVGEETADVILLYAFHRPSFVIDAYTRRFLHRLGFRFSNDAEIRGFFTAGLRGDFRLYGWYHWLILEHGILHCKKSPACAQCAFADACKGP